MSSKTPGQAAYEKWRESLAPLVCKTWGPLPWHRCSAETHDDWERIANAAIDAHHAMVDELGCEG